MARLCECLALKLFSPLFPKKARCALSHCLNSLPFLFIISSSKTAETCWPLFDITPTSLISSNKLLGKESLLGSHLWRMYRDLFSFPYGCAKVKVQLLSDQEALASITRQATHMWFSHNKLCSFLSSRSESQGFGN